METSFFDSFDAVLIAEEIRTARRALDLTQAQLAALVKNQTEVNLSQREISLLESGEGNPTLNKLEAIAKVLKKEWKLV